ncbi:MAG: endonuclease III [Polyangiaceae bacterium]
MSGTTTSSASGPAAQRDELKKRSLAIYDGLRALHPDAHCELDHRDAFQLLVATVLSAQTTDKLVNKVTPHLFERHPDAASLAAANVADVESILQTNGLGMYRQKSKNICGLARMLVEEHGGQVPRSMEALVKLPGVGRKTANVVLGVIWGTPEGVVVDTHVMRLAQRLGFTKKKDPEEIEQALCKIFPREAWDPLSHTLIFHGRRICFAIKPACSSCGVAALCPNAFKADKVGRKSVERAKALKAKERKAKKASLTGAPVTKAAKAIAPSDASARSTSRAAARSAAAGKGTKPVTRPARKASSPK